MKFSVVQHIACSVGSAIQTTGFDIPQAEAMRLLNAAAPPTPDIPMDYYTFTAHGGGKVYLPAHTVKKILSTDTRNRLSEALETAAGRKGNNWMDRVINPQGNDQGPDIG